MMTAEQAAWVWPDWVWWTVFIACLAFIALSIIAWGIWIYDWITGRDAEPSEEEKASAQHLAQLRRDVARLAELLSNHQPFSDHREEIMERLERLDKSDHEVFAEPPAKDLRKDFINRAGWAVSQEKHYDSREERDETVADIIRLADELRTALTTRRRSTAAKVPIRKEGAMS